MLLRILTAVVLIPLVVALVWWAPPAVTAAAAALVAIAALLEFFHLAGRMGLRAFRKWTMFSAALLFYAQYSLGLVFIILLAAQRHILPAGGMQNVAGGGGLGDLFQHLLLPGVTAALVPLGIVARMFRSSLLEVLGQDYIEALRARGIPPARLYLPQPGDA